MADERTDLLSVVSPQCTPPHFFLFTFLTFKCAAEYGDLHKAKLMSTAVLSGRSGQSCSLGARYALGFWRLGGLPSSAVIVMRPNENFYSCFCSVGFFIPIPLHSDCCSFLPVVQDSSQAIPLVVESCIRFISRHGEFMGKKFPVLSLYNFMYIYIYTHMGVYVYIYVYIYIYITL